MPRLVLRPACLACLALLAACGPSLPELANRTAAEGPAAPYPRLVPLGPLLGQADVLAPPAAGPAGEDLVARAADLRRRAAALRAMPL
jgi:hypothetical protein